MSAPDKVCKCDNCTWTGLESALACDLENVPDLNMRLDAGSVVPAGECPNCGCLAYLSDIAETAAPHDPRYPCGAIVARGRKYNRPCKLPAVVLFTAGDTVRGCACGRHVDMVRRALVQS